MRRLMATSAICVSVLSALAGTALAGTATARYSPPATRPYHMSAAIKRLSQELLVAGDRQMMRASAPGRAPLASGGSFFAGYSDSMVTGNHVHGTMVTFAAPALDCARSTYGTSNADVIYIWSGIDGVQGNSVEQDGLDAYCLKGDSTTHYASWYYICCNGGLPIQFNPIDLQIQAGDSIRAQVCAPNYCGGLGYYFEVDDVTNGRHWNAEYFCPSGDSCINATAEGIMEVGSAGVASLGTQWDLANYRWLGTNGNTEAVVTSDNGFGTFAPLTGAWTNQKWTMSDQNGTVMTSTGALSNGGQDWTYTFKNCC